MNQPPGDDRPPMAVAMQWVSQITTIVMEMVLPGLAGQWLDNRWGTKFIALLGFALGITVAITHLIAMTKPRSNLGSGERTDKGPSISRDDSRSQDRSSDSSSQPGSRNE